MIRTDKEKDLQKEKAMAKVVKKIAKNLKKGKTFLEEEGASLKFMEPWSVSYRVGKCPRFCRS